MLQNQKRIIQKYEDSDLVGSIAAMTDAVALKKQNNQAESPAGFNEENITTPAGTGIVDNIEVASTKKGNDLSQKDSGGDTLGGISAMTVDTILEK